MHVAEILQRQEFILKLARALMMFGAPSHRLEAQLQATAKVLDINVSVINLPNIMLLSFGDPSTHTSETKFLKQGPSLDLAKLRDAHMLYWRVTHDEIGVTEASAALDVLMLQKPVYRGWMTVLIGGLCSAFITPVSFNGSFIDALISFPLGCLLVWIQNRASKNELYSNVFEITVACVSSFLAAALASTHKFCYAAVASGSVVLILPGYIVLTGSLELASRGIISGAVRMGYSVIYSLFLGFGLAIGGEIYSQITGQQVYNADDYQCGATHDPNGPWYQQTASVWWAFLCVPMYSLVLSMRNQGPVFRKEMFFTILFACSGWVANHFASKKFVNRADISSACGSLIVGVLGNLYGRVYYGNAFVVMITGILFQLPSGLSNGGLLAFASQTQSGSTTSYATGFQTAEQLVQVAIGLTVGLFVASVLVHPFQSRRRGAGLFSL
ncbi:DUF1212-domain-containing protein [Clavulina sp. PMI_390]|nr:DUF1212-domain-containing protein [Clavulina sp. PMI_390]